jgi:DNA-3-methyladenine glycosylase I
MLVLEGAQAGLSWITILRKRRAYRDAFLGFDPERVARFTARDVARLLADPGIVRNRLKIESAITNARAVLDVAARVGSLDRYLWSFVDGRPTAALRLQWRPCRARRSQLFPSTDPHDGARPTMWRRRTPTG